MGNKNNLFLKAFLISLFISSDGIKKLIGGPKRSFSWLLKKKCGNVLSEGGNKKKCNYYNFGPFLIPLTVCLYIYIYIYIYIYK